MFDKKTATIMIFFCLQQIILEATYLNNVALFYGEYYKHKCLLRSQNILFIVFNL